MKVSPMSESEAGEMGAVMPERRIPVARLGVRAPAHANTLDKAEGRYAVPPNIAARRECSQCLAPLPQPHADLLGLAGGADMLERHIKLFVAGKPILTAISYLPSELRDASADSATAWHDVPIDELAVTGHVVIPGEYMESWARLPTPSECVMLGVPKGAKMPVDLLSQAYQVQIDDRILPAGLILLVRSDRAHMHWSRKYQGLVLAGS